MSSTPFAETPRIGFVVSVIKRFNTLLTLPLAHLGGICNFEKSWRCFNKPLRINNSYLTHVLLCGHDKLMINNPVRLSLEESTTWMYINWLILNQGSVTFLWVFPCCMEEKPCCYCFPYLCEVLSSTDNIQFIPEMHCQK